MTRYDQKILFTALAFIAVALKDGENVAKDNAQRVETLAHLLGDFCANKVQQPFSDLAATSASDNDASQIDAAIDGHIKALRGKQETILPEDLESLTKLYLRLQTRKTHRINAVLFEQVDASKMADLVLGQLDDEIEYLEGLS